jgi:hypothetical protein
MQARRRFIAVFALTVIGVWGATYLATSKWQANEAITEGAPQQTVAALWAVMDLLVVLAWIGAGIIVALAWVGRLLAVDRTPMPAPPPVQPTPTLPTPPVVTAPVVAPKHALEDPQ